MNPTPTTNAPVASLPNTRGGRLRAARAKRFESARYAAMALGIPVSTYSSHERAEAPGRRDYSPEQAQRYARRFGVTAEWLLFGPPETAKKPTTTKRTIVGYIGLNGEVFFYAVAPENLEQIEIPELVTASTVAFEIRGRSMGAYLRGWHLLFDDDRLPPTPDLVGKLCVVTL